MARAISTALNLAQLSPLKRKKLRVEIFDLLAGDNTMTDVVVGGALNAQTTGPFDFTPLTQSVTVEEVGGDYAQNGIPSAVVTLLIKDPRNRFNPNNLQVNPNSDARFLRRNNAVRIFVGDARAPEEDWPAVFTGFISGNAGLRRTQAPLAGGPVAELQIRAISREAQFLRYPSTSRVYARDTTFQFMVEDIAQNDMGLDILELALPIFGGRTTQHTATQFVDEPPLVTIAKILFVDGFLPRFTGEGKLGAVGTSTQGSPARIYSAKEEGHVINGIEHVFGEVNPFNSIRIVGLDGEMSKVRHPRQTLAEVRMTTGYFSTNEEEDIFWSDDRTRLAENIDLVVLKSVGLSLFGSSFGADEDFTAIAAPGPGEGTIGATLEIETGFAPFIIGFLTATYVGLAFIPDSAPQAPAGVLPTISIGRLLQAIALAAILLVMTRIGRGTYRFEGDPFEYVFQELRARAEPDGIRSFERVELEIQNHLINDQATADAIAISVLRQQLARGNPRTINMHHDLVLEPNDILNTSDDRRFQLSQLSYTLTPGDEALLAIAQAFEVTDGSLLR